MFVVLFYNLLFFKVIRELDKLIRQFNDNYMVLQKYISDAARKLEEIWSKANIVSWCRVLYTDNYLPTCLVLSCVE